METSPKASKNQTHSNHHHHNPSSSSPSSSSSSSRYESQSNLHNQNGIMSINSIIIIIISIISISILFAILLIILLLHRLKSTRDKSKNLDCKENCNNGGTFIPTNSANNSYASSPDIKTDCLYPRNASSFRQLQQQQQQRGRRKSRAEGVQVFTYRELEIATNNFSEENVIGSGGYGVVYRGILSDGTVAAIKRLHMHNNNDTGNGKHEERSFRLEVDLMSRLQCPYLVELFGYCADQNHRILIFEYMPNGALEHHLHGHDLVKKPDNQSQPLDWGTRLRIALDCARALEFLHEFAFPAVIHRDFKCTNVLLDQNFRARVSDFGLAKMGSDKINGQISTRVLGTTGYLAPEYASTGKVTTKSDVYSYGVVLLQLLTGRPPIDSRRPPGEDILVSWALPRLTNREKVSEMVDPTLEGQYSKKDLIQVAAIAAVCVQGEAEYRPLMTDVVQSLIPLVKTFNQNSGSCRFHSPTSTLS
ncbi:PREDICTED: serine/threonine-protein kinase CDL1 [Tarenaya hassleriana]|uniref:serine/threonine-protein kinase CDL1 n=1 Tax=Tarenaya hassleriana TaxID=28532 RepID=UPI00053C29B1|nr:PREDICTED: serine/threonine-protein kinase CDL1 [Tarenaya hassleriana]